MKFSGSLKSRERSSAVDQDRVEADDGGEPQILRTNNDSPFDADQCSNPRSNHESINEEVLVGDVEE